MNKIETQIIEKVESDYRDKIQSLESEVKRLQGELEQKTNQALSFAQDWKKEYDEGLQKDHYIFNKDNDIKRLEKELEQKTKLINCYYRSPRIINTQQDSRISELEAENEKMKAAIKTVMEIKKTRLGYIYYYNDAIEKIQTHFKESLPNL